LLVGSEPVDSNVKHVPSNVCDCCLVPIVFLGHILVVLDDGVSVLNSLFGLLNDMVVADGEVRACACDERMVFWVGCGDELGVQLGCHSVAFDVESFLEG